MFKVVAPFVAALAIVAMIGGVAFAEKTHDGLVVSVAEGKLTMTDKSGKNEHSHTIGEAVKISLDGKDAKLADLKKDDKITVTQDDAGKVTAVKATRSAK